MDLFTRKSRFYLLAFLRHDLKASVTVFFVALPLCLGISLASGAPVYSGLVAGILGGLLVSLLSGSQLSVAGPAAGLTAVCASAITDLGAPEVFFLCVLIAGLLQCLLGLFKLGGFTHFIPSAVIKGMLAAIGVILISKQVPLLIGYGKPDFWRNEFFNIITFNHAFSHIKDLVKSITPGVIIISALSFGVLQVWENLVPRKWHILPTSFLIVIFGTLTALLWKYFLPSLALSDEQYVSMPANFFAQVRLPDFSQLFQHAEIWKYSVIIAVVASLETLLSIEAIDKLDPYNRITPQNRELVAQGVANTVSGLLGGLPITAVIVRSSANAEAGARTKLSAFAHGAWLLLLSLLAVPLLNKIPYCALAVILIRTGYQLARPSRIKAIWRQGREQFLPFMVTVVAILFTDLLIGVGIGVGYAIWYLIKHTYRAGLTVKEKQEGHIHRYDIQLAMNVSFLNKKKLLIFLDRLPQYAHVCVDGTDSVYIDHDILEILHDFRSKAHHRHIQVEYKGIPDVESIELH
jgi:MFS superfamily sulfate permease-like transporter